MSTFDELHQRLGEPLATALLAGWLGEPVSIVTSGLLGIASRRLRETQQRNQAKRRFEELAEKICSQLVPLFEREIETDNFSIPAIADQLARTIKTQLSAELLVFTDLNPAALANLFRERHCFPAEQFSSAEVSLYERALDETARYIVGIGRELPKFEEAFAAEVLARLTAQMNSIDRTLEAIQRIETEVIDQARHITDSRNGAEHARFEADYRQTILQKLDYVELFGADLNPEAKRHALSVAYIALNLGSEEGAEEEIEITDEDDGHRDLIAPAEAVLDKLSLGDRLLIRGDAGSGKSTLFRWAALEAAKGGSEQYYNINTEYVGADSWRAKVPFLVRLRDCERGRLPPVSGLPSMIYTPGVVPDGWAVRIFAEGRGLLMLDGVDEVPNHEREELANEIRLLLNDYPKTICLVSTRPAGVPKDWLADAGFRESRIDPLSRTDQDRFIEKWHLAVGQRLEDMLRHDDKLPDLAESLKAQLRHNPSIARLATNPLLCAMVCALHRERQQKLPESQGELCEALCHMLLHRRERESGLDPKRFPEPYGTLDYERKRMLLVELAYHMVLNGEASKDVDSVDSRFADHLEKFPNHNRQDASVVRKSLVERSGLLREQRPGYIDFIHNTFRDFLAADRFAAEAHLGLLVQRALDDSWRPVILFAAACRQSDFASRLVEKLLQTSEESSQLSRRAYALLALNCRAVAIALDRELHARLEQLQRELFPPKNMTEANLLAYGGDAAVRFLRKHSNSDARSAAASVRALRLIGTEAAMDALEAYKTDMRVTVARELARAINPLELKLYIQQVRRGRPLPYEVAQEINDFTPLLTLEYLKKLLLPWTNASNILPLSRFKMAEIIEISGAPISDLEALSCLENLEQIGLRSTPVNELKALENLKRLEVINLQNTSISNIDALSRLSNLKNVNLAATLVDDISALENLEKLSSISLNRSNVTDLSPLSQLEQLRRLSVGHTKVENISSLSALNRLECLSLRTTRVTDLSPLSRLQSIKTIDISNTNVSDISALKEFAHLQEIDVSSSRVADLAPLEELLELKAVWFCKSPVVDLAPLKKLKKIKSIGLSEVNVVDLDILDGFEELSEVILSSERLAKEASERLEKRGLLRLGNVFGGTVFFLPGRSRFRFDYEERYFGIPLLP